MSFVDRIVSAPVRAGAPPKKTELWLQDALNLFTSSSSGKHVSVDRALGLAAVWAAVWLRADQLGSLPLLTCERSGGTLKPKDITVSPLLASEPNPEMTAMDLWSIVSAHLDLWGNAYLGKEFRRGRLFALWPIEPEKVTPRRVDGVKVYDVIRADGEQVRYGNTEIIHILGPSRVGLVGLSPIHVHRESIGLGIKLAEHSGKLMSEGGVPAGILSIKGRITDATTGDRLRKEWKQKVRGRHDIGVLDEGATFQPISMPLEDAQFVEQRKLSVQDVARIFRIPPEMIAGESGGTLTYSNVEAQSIQFLRYALRPWLVRIEQALARDPDLFPSRTFVPQFQADELLRGDTLSRYRALRVALGNGVPFITAAEARAMDGSLADDPRFDVVPAAKPAPAPGAPAPQETQP